VHYPPDASGRGFATQLFKDPQAADLDSQYSSVDASVVFYGHNHSPSDVQGRRRYVNPGALGCSTDPVPRYCSLEISTRGFKIEHHTVAYDRTELFRAFEERKVPERDFIQRFLFGRGA
jgi:diadenosine tetraphosphatase ApaH/serine/threonine PP2A family protein phosphatase